MQEQAALLPGSQAGEEGTSVWSHGAHRFPVTSTSAHPPTSFSLLFTLLSLFLFHFFFSLSLLCHWIFFLTSSHLCLPYASHTGPHRFTLWKIKKPTAGYLFAGAGRTHTHTHTCKQTRYVFSLEAGCSPDRKDIFTCHWHGLTVKNTASIFTGCVYLLVWKKDVEVAFKEDGDGCWIWRSKERDNERE